MRMEAECVQCVVNHAMWLFQKSARNDDGASRLFLRRLLDSLAGADLDAPPPEYARTVYGILYDYNQVEDNYAEAKRRSTEIALRLLPELEAMVAAHPRPFEAAVRFAIGGNIIDYGVNPAFDVESAASGIRAVLTAPLDAAMVDLLERDMAAAGRIFYILDNCGEAVLDRLLIERFRDKVTLGVRGRYVLNDVTREDLCRSGLSGYPAVDTGDGAPGVSLAHSSPEFLDVLNGSDLIVAKGQGNYETLDEYRGGPIYHLLRLKCPVVARKLNAAAPGEMRIIRH